jgi:hypothetical protein
MASRSVHHQLPKRAVEAARRRRAIFLFTVFVAAIALLVFWGWGRESRRQERARALDSVGGQADAGAVLDELPETPSREEVAKTLRALNPLVALCGEGKGGVVRVHLAITGKTGQVKEASVVKQFAGTELADCVVEVVSRAQFPRFRKKTLTVVFPYPMPSLSGDAGVDGAPDVDGAP